MKSLGKYSFGLGDRFGHQGHAQLRAIIEAERHGYEITPVWNKSNREHSIIGTNPSDVRSEADKAAKSAGYMRDYFVDADHINYETVDRFIESSDFFTIDVASYIGKRAEESRIEAFLREASKYEGRLEIRGLKRKIKCNRDRLREIAENFLYATIKAGEVYRKIERSKGTGGFVTEVSMDEVALPQSPEELFFILQMLSLEGVPLQTIAPKFSGRFNKGVDYSGDPLRFAMEFEDDVLVINHAVREFGLPQNLKISVHSGSDKFSIYPLIGRILKKHDRGLHLKTAGTTWLEEVIGLAESEGEGLLFVKEMYIHALEKIEELCAPYSDVIEIDYSRLPSAEEVMRWNGKNFAASIRHIKETSNYNADMRQLIHVGYKLAAERMETYFRLLEEHEEIISECVFENIYNRHICRLFRMKKGDAEN